MKQKNKMVLHTGTTSLLLIFTVLALVVFALLSFSAASVRWRLAEKMADRTTGYHAAVWEVCKEINDLKQPDGELKGADADGIVTITVPVTDKQELEAAVRMTRSEDGTSQLVLDQWKLVEDGSWTKDNTLHVYGSE